MQRGKRNLYVIWGVTVILILFFLNVVRCVLDARTEEKRVEIELYYLNPCDSCQEDEVFRKTVLAALNEQDLDISVEFEIYNMFKADDQRKMEERIRELNLDIKISDVPAALVNDRLYLGSHEEIAQQLAAKFAQGMGWENAVRRMRDVFQRKNTVQEADSETIEKNVLFEQFSISGKDAVVVYFYREDCPECIDLEPFIESLPQTVAVEGEQMKVNLIRLNSREDNNRERIYALFEAYGVPEDDQMVPIVFFRDGYLAGGNRIEENMLLWLEEGRGNGFAFPE